MTTSETPTTFNQHGFDPSVGSSPSPHPASEPQQPASQEPESDETERLDPMPEVLALESGTRVRVLPLKMRQLFRLLRIVTRGGAAYLPMLREALAGASEEEAADAFGTQLMAIAVIALPEAEDEAIDFLLSVVEPEQLPGGRDKQSRERADEIRTQLVEELYNPEPEDTLTIIETVISREKEDLVSLGKRLGTALRMATKTGQVDQKAADTLQESTAQIQRSSEGSPEPATSSHQNMDGQTGLF